MTLEEFIEEQRKVNSKLESQNKQNKKSNLFMLFLCLFISGISSVASYTLGASSVGYTPRDSNWNVSNTQEAIDNLFDSVGSALVGSVYSYMGVITPPGYLACDGSTYNIEDYPRLANHINVNFGSYNYFGGDGETTFAVPDLRGEFLRGTGSNSHSWTDWIGQTTREGSGAAVGVHQTSTVSPGIWTGETNDNRLIMVQGVTGSGKNQDSYLSATQFNTSVATGNNAKNNMVTAYTSRPTNTSVLYIIKY